MQKEYHYENKKQIYSRILCKKEGFLHIFNKINKKKLNVLSFIIQIGKKINHFTDNGL